MSRKITIKTLLPFLVVAGLVIYFVLMSTGNKATGEKILLAITLLGTLPLVWNIIVVLFQRRLGIDLIAIVAIIASLWIGQIIAAAIILLMLSGGEFLEEFALKQSRKELKSLLEKAPKIAHRISGIKIEDIRIELLKINELVLVKPGEVIPVDGVVVDGKSSIDESTITGESVPVFKSIHSNVLSGTSNIDGILKVKALKSSKDSKYEQIVKLIKEAEQNRAPFVRLADRYSIIFTIISFSIALLAYFFTKNPLNAVTVLVVATPCPLILATPIAFASGISKAAHKGVVFKSGGVIEVLAEAKALIFDKTGTLTFGQPKVKEVIVLNRHYTKNDLIFFAASLEQFSQHILAKALLNEAKSLKIKLMEAKEFKEKFGEGLNGKIGSNVVSVGKKSFMQDMNIDLDDIEVSGSTNNMHFFIAINNKIAGIVTFADTIRPNIKNLFDELKTLGVKYIAMLTGDKAHVAKEFAQKANLDYYRAECLPEDKVNEVRSIRKKYKPVIMIGDGINDAPALATADAGIAMGVAGSSATTESGDVVIMVNDISRVELIISLSQKVLSIAKQGIFIGISVSIVLMIIGAFGLFTPVFGAITQEVLDVIVIFNALRVNIQK